MPAQVMQASGHFSYPHENNQPVLAPTSWATGTGNCCLHGFPVDTAGHHPDHPHWVPRHQHPWCRAVGYPPKGGQASGHSGYPHKTFVKQLDTPAVRTRAPKQLDTPPFLHQAHGQQSQHKIPQQLDTPWPSTAKAEANPGYQH